MPFFILLFSDSRDKLQKGRAEEREIAKDWDDVLSWIACRAQEYGYVEVLRVTAKHAETVFIAGLDDLADTLDDLFKEWAFDNGCRCPE